MNNTKASKYINVYETYTALFSRRRKKYASDKQEVIDKKIKNLNKI